MMRLESCCERCVGCGLVWCRDEVTSPGEGWDLCLDCFEAEDPFVLPEVTC